MIHDLNTYEKQRGIVDLLLKDGSYGEFHTPCASFHYSDPTSQGALAYESPNFPIKYNDELFTHHSAYSDRIRGWDYERSEEANNIIGTGDQ